MIVNKENVYEDKDMSTISNYPNNCIFILTLALISMTTNTELTKQQPSHKSSNFKKLQFASVPYAVTVQPSDSDHGSKLNSHTINTSEYVGIIKMKTEIKKSSHLSALRHGSAQNLTQNILNEEEQERKSNEEDAKLLYPIMEADTSFASPIYELKKNGADSNQNSDGRMRSNYRLIPVHKSDGSRLILHRNEKIFIVLWVILCIVKLKN